MSDYSDDKIESDLVAKGLVFPRITLDDIEGVIAGEQYHRFPGTTMTVCCLYLKNGYCVVGESAAVSRENFDYDIGKKIARQHAKDKIWSLEGYLLRQRLHDG